MFATRYRGLLFGFLMASLLLTGGAAFGKPATGTLCTHHSGLLAEGTEWETPWYEIDSGVEGPVLVVGIVRVITRGVCQGQAIIFGVSCALVAASKDLVSYPFEQA